MNRQAKIVEVQAKDLSVIEEGSSPKINEWLKSLFFALENKNLVISPGKTKQRNPEPIIEYRNGQWWAGRYVGQIQFEGRVLIIKPRFEATFISYVSKIWNIRMLPQQGEYANTNLWLWEMIARIWESKLVAASKHGLPYIREEESEIDYKLRGRLDIKKTAALKGSGLQKVASQCNKRILDYRIGAIILAAYNQLHKELRLLQTKWVSDRGRELLSQLGGSIGPIKLREAVNSKAQVKFRPITEMFRPLVEMSWDIIHHKPFASIMEGKKSVTGVLIDVAEIWEMYVHQLIKDISPDIIVEHEGRSIMPISHLYSNQLQKTLGGLKPDFILRNYLGECLGVIDAKYKHTKEYSNRPSGILREDLYQIHAYQSAFSSNLDKNYAALVYPLDVEGNIVHLQNENPWFLTDNSGKELWFFGVSPIDLENTEDKFSRSEMSFIQEVMKWERNM